MEHERNRHWSLCAQCTFHLKLNATREKFFLVYRCARPTWLSHLRKGNKRFPKSPQEIGKGKGGVTSPDVVLDSAAVVSSRSQHLRKGRGGGGWSQGWVIYHAGAPGHYSSCRVRKTASIDGTEDRRWTNHVPSRHTLTSHGRHTETQNTAYLQDIETRHCVSQFPLSSFYSQPRRPQFNGLLLCYYYY
jgi:hypothetical protein